MVVGLLGRQKDASRAVVLRLRVQHRCVAGGLSFHVKGEEFASKGSIVRAKVRVILHGSAFSRPFQAKICIKEMIHGFVQPRRPYVLWRPFDATVCFKFGLVHPIL